MMQRRALLHAMLGAGLVPLGLPLRAFARSYPQRPLAIVVGYTPGSANDILVRLVAPDLGDRLGQAIVVHNKPGAGGSIGMTAAANAKPDGYTLGLASTATMAINPALYRSLSYDPLKDFTPTIKLATTPNVLVVPASSPIQTVPDLIRTMGTKVLNYSSPGNGTTQHLTGVMFAQLVGHRAEHIPFKGPAEAVVALATAQLDYGFASLPSALGQIRENRLRALAVTPPEPVPTLPSVPSLSRFGLSGFEKTDVWFGLVVPAGTPSDVVQDLHRAATQTLKNAEVRDRLAGAGYEPARPASAEEFAQFVREQVAFWADLVKTSGATVD